VCIDSASAASAQLKRDASGKGPTCLELDVVFGNERVIDVVHPRPGRETRSKLARKDAQSCAVERSVAG
jgi:hypothetical protein